MIIQEILTRLYAHSKKVGRTPVSKDKQITAAFKESYRKIGTGRKALFISGAITNERNRDYPQMSYVHKRGGYRMDERSIIALGMICVKNHVVKERII